MSTTVLLFNFHAYLEKLLGAHDPCAFCARDQKMSVYVLNEKLVCSQIQDDMLYERIEMFEVEMEKDSARLLYL